MKSIKSLPRPKVSPWAPRGDIAVFLLTAVTLVSLASLSLVVQNSHLAAAGYEARRLEQVRDDWAQRLYQLEAEVASLQSLDRLEREAKARLQMVYPKERLYVTVNQPSLGEASIQREAPGPSRENPQREKPARWWEFFLRPFGLGGG